jgi:MFS transporter, PPP family, 3-phenylpropionic acid transporter
MKRDTNVLLFRFLYFAAYFADAFFTPFYGLYLKSLHFSDLEVSIALGVIPFAACLGSVLIGRFAKSFHRNLFLLRLLVLLELAGVLLLAFLSAYPALLATVILLAFANGVYYQVEDGAGSYCFKRNGKKFSKLRIYGSIGFGVALGILYFLLQVLSYRWIFVCAAGVYVLCLVLLSFLHDYPDEESGIALTSTHPQSSLFHNSSFVFFFFFYIFLNGAMGIQGYILPLYLDSLGLSKSAYSLLNAFRVAVETVTVLCYAPIKKLFRSERNCLLLGAFILFLSSLAIVIFPDPYPIAFANYFCRGVGGALLFIGFVDYLSAILPSSLLTRGMAFASAAMDIFVGSFNFASSAIYTATSYLTFFWILAGISFLGFAFLFGAKDERNFPAKAPKETE